MVLWKLESERQVVNSKFENGWDEKGLCSGEVMDKQQVWWEKT